jgi:hypothetical protein
MGRIGHPQEIAKRWYGYFGQMVPTTPARTWCSLLFLPVPAELPARSIKLKCMSQESCLLPFFLFGLRFTKYAGGSMKGNHEEFMCGLDVATCILNTYIRTEAGTQRWMGAHFG